MRLKNVVHVCSLVVVPILSRCATPPANKSEGADVVAGAHSSESDGVVRSADGMSVIKKPYGEAIEIIREECQNQYEVITDSPPTSEVGISVNVGRDSHSPQAFTRYRCKR